MILYNKTTEYVYENNTLANHQYGFRKTYYTLLKSGFFVCDAHRICSLVHVEYAPQFRNNPCLGITKQNQQSDYFLSLSVSSIVQSHDPSYGSSARCGAVGCCSHDAHTSLGDRSIIHDKRTLCRSSRD